jgi:hypothetical protein
VDSFNEKKWFVYMGDHHEGPFSLSEVQVKVAQGVVHSQQYVWCDGMSDWLPMTQVTDFQSLVNGKTDHPSVSQPTQTILSPQHEAFKIEPQPDFTESPQPSETLSPEPALELSAADFEPVLVEEKSLSAIPIADVKQEPSPQAPLDVAPVAELVAEQPSHSQAQSENAAQPKAPSSRRSALVLFLIGFVIAGSGYFANQFGLLEGVKPHVRPFLRMLGDRVPALGRWISPLPEIPELKPDQITPLELAARAPLRNQGLRVEALLQGGIIFVGTNLPEGTNLELVAVGKPETLLNRFKSQFSAQATVARSLGRFLGFKGDDGGPVPIGSYWVYIYESDTQSEPVRSVLVGLAPAAQALPDPVPMGRKVAYQAEFFFGGAENDPQYRERLSKYHELLREESKTQLEELTQFSSTLSSLFNSAVDKYTALSREPKRTALRKDWDKFYEKFVKMNTQLQETFSKWQPDEKERKFHGRLYLQTKEASLQLVEMLNFMNGYILQPQSSAEDFQQKLVELNTRASKSLTELAQKILNTGQLPLTPNGMPQRGEQ